MRPLVYLIGVSKNRIEQVTALLEGLCEVKRISRAGLMTTMMQRKPQCLVVIESDMDTDSLIAVDSSMSLEYVPTVCISFKKHPMDVVQHISGASYVVEEGLDLVLPAVVAQSINFSHAYNELRVSYDTYEIMTEEIGNAMDVYVDPRVEYSSLGIIQYFDNVYKSNIFLDSFPEFLWMIKSLDGHNYEAVQYNLQGVQQLKEVLFYDETFSFEDFNETGFFKNCDSGALSDIDDIGQMVPEKILRQIGDIKNIACYANHNVMLIAIDYKGQIAQSDLNILKALTIKVDMMVGIKNQVNALEASFIYTMNALARAAEGKDDVTGHHIKRVNMYSKLIAEVMAMDRDFIQQIQVAAQMHDVGKILIPDEILNKPGKLTDDEYETIKNHTVFGEKVIGESDHLTMASRIARGHHEKYDGSGYPDRLKGETIPIEARIVAMADIYDALRSPRPYKRGFSHLEAYDIIVVGDGRVEPYHFDPKVLAVFKEHHEAFCQIYESLKDEL